MLLLGFNLTLIGLMILSFSIHRHRIQALPSYKELSRFQLLIIKSLGATCLAAAIAAAISLKGYGAGLVYFFAWISLAALAHSLLLSYRPKWAPGLLVATSISSALITIYIN